MKLTLNGTEHSVVLTTVLTQNLYKKINPILSKLESTRGADTAYKHLLAKRIQESEYLRNNVKWVEGEKAWDEVKNDPVFLEVVSSVLLEVRENLLDYIAIDEETTPTVFELFRECLDKKLITNPELLDAINTPLDSEFWCDQDINGILEELRFFRSNVLQRIKRN
jgi:hypothetical protein